MAVRHDSHVVSLQRVHDHGVQFLVKYELSAHTCTEHPIKVKMVLGRRFIRDRGVIWDDPLGPTANFHLGVLNFTEWLKSNEDLYVVMYRAYVARQVSLRFNLRFKRSHLFFLIQTKNNY